MAGLFLFTFLPVLLIIKASATVGQLIRLCINIDTRTWYRMASLNLPHSCDGAIDGIRRRRKATIRSYQPDATVDASKKIPENEPTGTYPRLSIPVEFMRHSYDHVIIGSGYGGGVAASRMARTGDSVCVLERGDERWPGEYPTYAEEVVEQLHCSGNPKHFPATVKGAGSKANGFYHNIALGSGLNCLVCNGEEFLHPLKRCLNNR